MCVLERGIYVNIRIFILSKLENVLKENQSINYILHRIYLISDMYIHTY